MFFSYFYKTFYQQHNLNISFLLLHYVVNGYVQSVFEGVADVVGVEPIALRRGGIHRNRY